jgi:hypothetical protein
MWFYCFFGVIAPNVEQAGEWRQPAAGRCATRCTP